MAAWRTSERDEECFELLWCIADESSKGKVQVCSDSVGSFYLIVVSVQLKFCACVQFVQ